MNEAVTIVGGAVDNRPCGTSLGEAGNKLAGGSIPLCALPSWARKVQVRFLLADRGLV